MKKLTFLLIFCLNFSVMSHAGWKITLMTTSEEMGEQYEVTLQAQDNNIRWTSPQMEMIYNAGSKELIFLNNSRKMYWKGTKEKYKEDMEAYVKRMMIQAMGEEAYEEYKKSMEEITDADPMEDDMGGKVEIIPEDETITLDGYTGKKFAVMMNGELNEELWLSKEIDLYEDIDFSEIDGFFDENTSGPSDESGEYDELFRQHGFPIKEITYDYGEQMEETVLVNAEETEIPQAVFDVPVGYEKAEIEELFSQGFE